MFQLLRRRVDDVDCGPPEMFRLISRNRRRAVGEVCWVATEFDAEAFSETVRAIYDAALSYEKWPQALARIGALFDGEGAVVIFYNRAADADFIYSEGLREAVELYQKEGWWKRDLHAQRAIQMHLSVGDIFDDLSIATIEEMENHPIYVDFFERVGFGWLMSCVVLPDRDVLVALSVPRAKAKGAYSERERKALQLVGRHVEQSLRLSLRIADLDASERTMRAALDAVDAGIFALGAGHRVIFANTSADALRGNYFSAVGDHLVPAGEDERRGFEAMLDAVEAVGMRQALPVPCTLTGRDGGRAVVWALPVVGALHQQIGMADAACALLLAVPMDATRGIDPALLRDAFDLTLGEARVASLVGTGSDVRTAAKALSISEGTVRLVLKRVFRKFGVNRQAELVLRLAKLGGPVSGGHDLSGRGGEPAPTRRAEPGAARARKGVPDRAG